MIGSEALSFSLIAVCDHGDEVLIPEPFYTKYNGFGNSAGVNVVPITTRAEDGFHLPSKEVIEKLITSKTKTILLSNPGNPTGTVYTEEEMNMIKELAKEHNLYVIADRVIVTDSISKRYSACGARIGCIASKNKDLIKEILKLCQSRLCVPTIEQIGAATLSKVSDDYFVEVVEEYKKRRDIVYNALNEIDGVICKKPNGAFYIIAKLPVQNAEDFVIWLLKEFDVNNEIVLLAPAEGFYATKGLVVDEIRISYVLNEDSLKSAMSIIKEGLKTYLNE